MSIKFRCINNDEMDGILTKGREYAGEMAYHRDFLKIFRCDDKGVGYFTSDRFVEVVDLDSIQSKNTEVLIYTYTLDTGK